MLTLRQALDAIAYVLQPSIRFGTPKIQLVDGRLYAYNGQVAACVPFSSEFPSGSFVVDAGSFAKLWIEETKAAVKETTLILKTRRTRYTMNISSEFDFDFPKWCSMPDELVGITEEARDAILMAAKFASDNAIHPWACGVTLHEGRAIATNNIAVVSVECETPFEGTIPFWAVQVLRATGEPPRMWFGDEGLVLLYEDGVELWAAPLAAPMPPKLFDLVAELKEGDISAIPLREALADAFALGGRHCVLELAKALIRVSSESGVDAATELSLPSAIPAAPAITLSAKVAKLIFEEASAIGLELAPEKLTFSRDHAPKFKGLAAAMTP